MQATSSTFFLFFYVCGSAEVASPGTVGGGVGAGDSAGRSYRPYAPVAPAAIQRAG